MLQASHHDRTEKFLEMIPIPKDTYRLLKRRRPEFWARKFLVGRATILNYISQQHCPELLPAAVLNVEAGRKPATEAEVVFDHTLLRQPLHVIAMSPIMARHAYAYLKQHRKRMTKEDAAMLFLVARSKLKPWTERTYHDPRTGDTLRGASFDRLERNGWVRLSPRFRHVIFTRKGRDDLEKWNLTHT